MRKRSYIFVLLNVLLISTGCNNDLQIKSNAAWTKWHDSEHTIAFESSLLNKTFVFDSHSAYNDNKQQENNNYNSFSIFFNHIFKRFNGSVDESGGVYILSAGFWSDYYQITQIQPDTRSTNSKSLNDWMEYEPCFNSFIDGTFVADDVVSVENNDKFQVTYLKMLSPNSWQYLQNVLSKEHDRKKKEILSPKNMERVKDKNNILEFDIDADFKELWAAGKTIDSIKKDSLPEKYKNGYLLKFFDEQLFFIYEKDDSVEVVGLKNGKKFFVGKFTENILISKYFYDDELLGTFYQLKPFECYSIFKKNSDIYKINYVPVLDEKLNIQIIN